MQTPYIPEYHQPKKSISSQNTDLPGAFHSRSNMLLNTNISHVLQNNKSSQPRRQTYASFQQEAFYPRTTPDFDQRTPIKSIRIFDTTSQYGSHIQAIPNSNSIKTNTPQHINFMNQSEKTPRKQNLPKASVFRHLPQKIITFGLPTLVPSKMTNSDRFNEIESKSKPQNLFSSEHTNSIKLNNQLEIQQSGILTRKKIESALSEMKNKFLEMKAFSCDCNFFRLNIDSLLIRMLKHSITFNQIQSSISRKTRGRVQ